MTNELLNAGRNPYDGDTIWLLYTYVKGDDRTNVTAAYTDKNRANEEAVKFNNENYDLGLAAWVKPTILNP